MRLVDRDWKGELLDAAAAASGPVWLVCPFMKASVVTDIVAALPPHSGPLCVLTRFALRDFAAGVSDIGALRAAVEAGASVRGVRRLHAKLYVFGDAALVTSANLTQRGLTSNAEFGVITVDAHEIRTSVAYAEGLWKAAGDDVTLSRLDDWEAQLDVALRTAGQPSELVGQPDYGTQVDGHSDQVAELQPPVVNAWAAESGQGFAKIFGTGSSRVPWDTVVLDEMREGRSYYWATYPRRPWQPRDGDTLFLARTVRGTDDTLVFARAIALAHDPDRDVADARERASWPWVKDWPYYVRLHHVDAIDGTLADGFSLFELTDTLGAEAFVTTSERMAAGETGVNPRLSLRQQPAVRLTPQAAAWMTARLDECLIRHGRVSDADLAVLRTEEESAEV